MTEAEIVAELFGPPCDYSPIDEEMCIHCDCEHFCGDPKQTDAVCWQRYFNLKQKGGKEMSNIEKIKAEIERRKKICEGIFERDSDTYYQGKAVAYGEFLPFIDSVPEEKPSEDRIKEEADNYLYGDDVKPYFHDSYCDKNLYTSDDIRYAFKAGAEWAVDYMEGRK